MKENSDRKKVNSALQHLKADFWSIMGEECLNVLSLDYEEIIDIYGSKYPSRILLINPLSEN